MISLPTHYDNLQQFGQGGGKSNQRRSSVQDDASVVKFGSSVTEGNRVKIDFPVCLAPQRNLGHLPGVMILVHPTEHSLGFVAISIVGVTEVEGDDGLVNQALGNHAVEGRYNLIYANRIISKTHYAVKAAEGKSETWLFSSFRKQLILDLDVANLYGILRDKAAQATRPIPNFKLGAILLI